MLSKTWIIVIAVSSVVLAGTIGVLTWYFTRSSTTDADDNTTITSEVSITPKAYNYTWWTASLVLTGSDISTITSSDGDPLRNIVISSKRADFEIFVTSAANTTRTVAYTTTANESGSQTFSTGDTYTEVDISQIGFDSSDTHTVKSFSSMAYKPSTAYTVDVGLENADVSISAYLLDGSGTSGGTISVTSTNKLEVTPTKTGSLTIRYVVTTSEGDSLFTGTQSISVFLVPLSSTTISIPDLSVVFTYLMEFTSDADASSLTLTWPSATVYSHGTSLKYQIDSSAALTDGQVITTTWTHSDSTEQDINLTMSVTGSSTPGIYPVVLNVTSAAYTSNMTAIPSVENGTSYQRSSTTTFYMKPIGWIAGGADIKFYLYTSGGDALNFLWFRETAAGGITAGQTSDDDMGMMVVTSSSGAGIWSLVNTQVSNDNTLYLSAYSTNDTFYRRKRFVSLTGLFDGTDMAEFPDPASMVYVHSTSSYTGLADPATLAGNLLFAPTKKCESRLVDIKSSIVPLLTNTITMGIDYPLFLETISTVETEVIDMVWSKGVIGYTTATIHNATNTSSLASESGRWVMNDGDDIHSNLSSSNLPVYGDMAMDAAGNKVVVYTIEDIKDDTKANVTYQPAGTGTLASGFTSTSRVAISYSSTDGKCVLARWDPAASGSANVTLTQYDWTVGYTYAGTGQGYVTLSNAVAHANTVQADTIIGSDDGTVFACNLDNTSHTFIEVSGGTLTVTSSFADGAACGINGSYFWYLEDLTTSQTARFTTISDTSTVVISIAGLPQSATGWDAYYDTSSGKARVITFTGTTLTVYDSTDGLIYTKSASETIQKVRMTAFDSFYALQGTTAQSYTLVTGRIV